MQKANEQKENKNYSFLLTLSLHHLWTNAIFELTMLSFLPILEFICVFAFINIFCPIICFQGQETKPGFCSRL